MKQEYSSKEEILSKAQEIIYKEGLENLSMRRLANECYLALGTLYHYFPSKEDLLVLLMKNYWFEHFKDFFLNENNTNFLDTFSAFYDLSHKAFSTFQTIFIKQKVDGVKTLILKGKIVESKFKAKISQVLLASLNNDTSINKANFNENFTMDSFVLTLIDIVVMSLINHNEKKEFLLELIKKVIL